MHPRFTMNSRPAASSTSRYSMTLFFASSRSAGIARGNSTVKIGSAVFRLGIEPILGGTMLVAAGITSTIGGPPAEVGHHAQDHVERRHLLRPRVDPDPCLPGDRGEGPVL